ncbi:uncharacterized protein LOC134721860 [Mytilus trossulus]|uniref:uncharacterized protein LOC134721860 n=1 Tax=Mytilus trossulus TaxID=6551 RepID=UPI0030071965
MAGTKLKVHHYYIRNSEVPFEEDMFNEFKGHRNLAVEELPPWTQESTKDKASRRAVSRALNAMLNTGKGGKVYLGIVDSGMVRGLQLTTYQQDHVMGSLDDLMSRYKPPVKKHRYRIKFVPVVDPKCSEEEIIKQCSYDASDNIDETDMTERMKPHIFRSHRYCWCDKDGVAQFNCGVMTQDYVIEIDILPWNSKDPHNQDSGCGSLINLHPLHEDEEGSVYFRRQASLVKYSMSEICELTRQEARESLEEEVNRLKREIIAKEELC